MKPKSGFVLISMALACLAAIQGGEFWHKKEYQQWSERECRKLLEDSPWGQSYTLSQTLIEPLSTPSTDGAGERAREARPQISYQAEFRSALPIRQALVRLEQIRVKYDQMQPAQKQVADQRAKDFLAVRFPDTVVLHVAYSSNVQSDDRDLVRYWRSQTTDTLKNFVFLNAAGEKVPLLLYSVTQGAGREFQLVFPREYKGRQLIGPNDKTLQLEFPHPTIRGQAGSLVLIAFKVEKMLIQGKVVY
jgi:hypothetical protein